MELSLDVIAVILVFIGFCIGSAFLIKKANEEVKNQEQEKQKSTHTEQNKKNKK